MKLDIKSIKMHYFNTQTKKDDKDLHFQLVEKIVGGATIRKFQKEM